MAGAFTIPSIFTAIDKFSAPIRKMAGSTARFAVRAEANLARVDRSFRRVGRSISKSVGLIGRLGLGFSGLMIARQIATANIELDKSLQSLQAITGVTGKEFVSFRGQIDKVSKSQKIFAADTAKAFELVGSAKPELLANAEALGKVSEAAIILGKAGKLEVTDAVNSLTISMNQFGVGAEKATEFVDILATAQQKGSGTIAFLSEAMVNAGGTSRAFGNSFADTVAILEGFAKAGVPASEAGTQLAGILAKLSKVQNKDFNPQFTKATDIIKNLKKANLSYTELLQLTDVRGAKWITTIINQNDVVQKLTGNLNEVGNAQAQADIQTDSLRTKIKELTDSFQNQVTSTSESNATMSATKKILTILADNMGLLISIVITLIIAFVGFKTILFLTRAALFAYNIVLGISTVIMGRTAFALRGNTIAMAAYAISTKVATVATTLWGIALNIGLLPLTLIAIGIAATIALIVVIIKKWNTWGAALTLFMGPLGLIISLIQSFRRNWDMIKDAFKTGGILAGLKAIGVTILDAILMPLQQVFKLLSNIPGIGKFASKAVEGIEAFRSKLGVNVETDESGQPLGTTKELINPEAARQESLKETISEQRQNVSIGIKDETGRATVESDNNIVPVELTSTFAF